jgi:hypothetical protein
MGARLAGRACTGSLAGRPGRLAAQPTPASDRMREGSESWGLKSPCGMAAGSAPAAAAAAGARGGLSAAAGCGGPSPCTAAKAGGGSRSGLGPRGAARRAPPQARAPTQLAPPEGAGAPQPLLRLALGQVSLLVLLQRAGGPLLPGPVAVHLVQLFPGPAANLQGVQRASGRVSRCRWWRRAGSSPEQLPGPSWHHQPPPRSGARSRAAEAAALGVRARSDRRQGWGGGGKGPPWAPGPAAQSPGRR